MELLENLPANNKKIDLKKEIGRYLKKWPWILLSVVLFFVAAKVYLRYAQNQYVSKSSVKIESTQKGSIGELQNLGGSPLASKTGSGKEIPVLLSRPILYDVVKKVNADVSFVREGKVKDQQIYSQSPVEIRILSLKDPQNFSGKTYAYSSEGSLSFKLTSTDGKVLKLPFNAVCNVDFGSFIVKPKPGFNAKDSFKVSFLNAIKVAEGLQQRIQIAENSLNDEILELSLTSPVPDKSEAVLNTTISAYNDADLDNKRQQSQMSLDFIDERLEILTQDLGDIETQKEGYKRENQITDLAMQAEMHLQTANENTKELMEQATQLEMVNSVLNVANRSNNEQLLPTNVGMPSGLDQAIGQYNDLVITRNRTMRQATPSNPAIQEMNKEISSLRSLIKDNLTKSRQSIQMNIARINGQINSSRANINKFPTQEKIFRNIDRQQNLKESLYLYLLQKKEETSIAAAVTTPKVRVINPAYTVAGPVEPKSQQILLGSLLAGLLLPVLVMYGVFAFDTQIKSKKDVTDALPEIPVLAEIPLVGKDESDLIGKNDLSVFAEAFRILNSNLKFMRKTKTAPVYLFTSSVKGEGKTTVSINSAAALASNRKVILVGADLRNPQFGRYIPPSHVGLADYLAQDDDADYKKYVHRTEISPNLDVIQSGSIPPNPTDLLEDEKLGTLIEKLKQEYDYVLIDSTPMMMVSDSFHILRFADVVIYLVRANYTEKELLTYIDSVAHDENVKKIGIVVNDVHKNELRYGYGGKYSYGYTAEKEKKGFLDFFKKYN